MNFTAKKEKNEITFYNQSLEKIGILKILKDFNDIELVFDNRILKIILNKDFFGIKENEKILYQFKINSFWGNFEILEWNKEIKGTFLSKWKTQLIDEDKNIILKIRNQSVFFDYSNYDILIIDTINVTNFDILISLFAHIYGSRMKLRTVLY